nr:MAG TPA: hypothetical protein [Caudoviricetes sp.]
MNIEAIESMENFAKKALTLSGESQSRLWKELSKTLSTEEVETLQKSVALYDMYTNPAKYRAIKNAVAEMIWNENNK